VARLPRQIEPGHWRPEARLSLRDRWQPAVIGNWDTRIRSVTLRVYAHWLPDPMSAKLVDALDDTRPSATPAQPEAAVVGDRETLSALKSVVSRVGIEPTTRRLRDAPKRPSIAADLGKSGSAFSFESRSGSRTAACFGIRRTNLHTSHRWGAQRSSRTAVRSSRSRHRFSSACLWCSVCGRSSQRRLRRRLPAVARWVPAGGSGSPGKMTFALTFLCGKSFGLSVTMKSARPWWAHSGAFHSFVWLVSADIVDEYSAVLARLRVRRAHRNNRQPAAGRS
jgi:hypothetical protein